MRAPDLVTDDDFGGPAPVSDSCEGPTALKMPVRIENNGFPDAGNRMPLFLLRQSIKQIE